jgi:CRP-like cAMP-binding protein
MQVTNLPDRQDIVAEGDRASRCCLVPAGFVCRYRILAEGRRQIVSFHVPGEIPDLQSLHLKTMDHSVGTLAASKPGFISHADLCELLLRFKAVGLAPEYQSPLPVTQTELADALGLTVVRVNRVLRSLREDGMLRVDRNSVSILDRERTRDLAEFNPLYLHQDKEAPRRPSCASPSG